MTAAGVDPDGFCQSCQRYQDDAAGTVCRTPDVHAAGRRRSLAAVAASPDSDEVPLPPEPPADDEFVSAARYAAEKFDQRTASFDVQVEEQRRRIEVREAAARLVRAARSAPRPPVVPLGEFLDQDLGDATYRIDGLLPAGGRVMLAAQYKAGKSTLVGNLVRSLADGEVFLGEHAVTPVEGTVILLDTELDPRMLQDWYRRQAITNAHRVAVVSLRGRLSSFDITDPHVLAEWATELGRFDPSFVILDPLRPVLDALGLDEKSEGGRFLVAFDELLDRCGAGEAAVIHHMGHDHERARGDSRLRDWPDVEWRLVRKDADDPSSPRYFTAYGRDVDRPEAALTFNRDLGRLTLFGGSRRDGALDTIGDQMVALLDLTPGLSGQALDDRVIEAGGHVRKDVREARRRLVLAGEIVARRGKRNAVEHYVSGSPALLDPTAGQLATDEGRS